MYYFEKFNLDFMAGKEACRADFEDERKKFFEVIKLAAKFKRHLFDDYSFCIGERSKLEADFECAMRVMEIINAERDYFFVIKAEGGEIAGFWYLYDINFKRKYDENLQKIVKKPVTGTLAGCLKKEFWGKPAKEIMKNILKTIFESENFKKVKCETFSSNPYISQFLGKFFFRREGCLLDETLVGGKACHVMIWSATKKEYENLLAASADRAHEKIAQKRRNVENNAKFADGAQKNCKRKRG